MFLFLWTIQEERGARSEEHYHIVKTSPHKFCYPLRAPTCLTFQKTLWCSFIALTNGSNKTRKRIIFHKCFMCDFSVKIIWHGITLNYVVGTSPLKVNTTFSFFLNLILCHLPKDFAKLHRRMAVSKSKNFPGQSFCLVHFRSDSSWAQWPWDSF